MKKLLLNMIVKNEQANLPRCLGSLAPWISCYAITDTGSTDGTKPSIQLLLDDKPGLLTDLPFVNFAQARNAAYQSAQAANLDYEYILLCDADWELVVTNPRCFDNLTEPVYSIKTQDPPGKYEYALTRLVRRDVPCKFVGVTHEYPSTQPHVAKLLTGCHFVEYPTGASRPTKFQRDIKLLTDGLKTEPQNQRYKYYLGESNYWLSKFDEALGWYQKCLDPPSWEFDPWHAGFRIVQILQLKGMTADFISHALSLFDKHPNRAESLYALARHFQLAKQYRLGYEVARIGLSVPRPPGDTCHVETEVYDWGLKDVASICAFYVGKKEESRLWIEDILPVAPEWARGQIEANLRFCGDTPAESPEDAPSPWGPPGVPGDAGVTDPTGPCGPPGRAKCLVVCNVGDPNPAIRSCWVTTDIYDIAIINHGKPFQDRGGAAIYFENSDQKWRNIRAFFERFPILDRYEYFWFPDDDIGIDAAGVEFLFRIARARQLSLCQPGITGHVGWTITGRKTGLFRSTNFVEIMAPLFSREALAKCLPTFADNHSGWALDFVWPKLLNYQGIGIVDEIGAKHTRAFQSQDWLSPEGLTPAQEMPATLAKYGLMVADCVPREL